MNFQNTQEIYLAGGCFWGVEAFMKKIKGVISTEVGYANGDEPSTTYEQVCNGSGHAEVVKVIYDNNLLSLTKLLSFYFKIIDPTAVNQQGHDKGIQYRTGIYYTNIADSSLIQLQLSELQHHYIKPIVIECKQLEHYIPAENYHQDYLDKNPAGYCHLDIQQMKQILSEQ